MKIAVDCRYVRIGRHDGISRYTAGLVTELARLAAASPAGEQQSTSTASGQPTSTASEQPASTASEQPASTAGGRHPTSTAGGQHPTSTAGGQQPTSTAGGQHPTSTAGRQHPVTMLISDPRQLDMLPALPWFRVSDPTGPREPLVARQVNRLAPDVVFSPMQTMGSAGRRYALVLTVHDLIYYRHGTPPRDLPAPVRALWRLYHLAWWPQRLLLDRADAVVTVSETTAALIASHHLTKRPVTVVPNAADPLPEPAEGVRGVLADVEPQRGRPADLRRLVYMGSFMPYKNVDVLVRAAAALPEHELHLMSRVAPAERARLTALAPGARLVFHDGASDEEYAAALLGATALVSASRDEGFGIPLVEAMSVGTPVVVSDIPVFREVGDSAAAYVDPDDVDGFVTAIRALDDPAVRAERGEVARKRAAHYSWAASAGILLDLLERTAATHRR